MNKIVTALFILLLLASPALAGEKQQGINELKDNKDRTSYSLGHQIGTDFKKQKTDLDDSAFMKGVNDALAQKKPAIEDEEMSAVLSEMKKKIRTRQRAEKVEMVEQRLGGGKKFLEENAKKEGVITLESGLQYKVLREGTGKKPLLTDKVKVHYSGSLIDGTKFSNSYKKGKPEIFHVAGVTKGITEALQLMKEGAKWQIVLPPELAFSRRSELGYRTVIYDLELISIETASNEQTIKKVKAE
jgi:FKBP-type peptidyl-prolyl cis-trans isomerase